MDGRTTKRKIEDRISYVCDLRKIDEACAGQVIASLVGTRAMFEARVKRYDAALYCLLVAWAKW